jgi:hypothetical protein
MSYSLPRGRRPRRCSAHRPPASQRRGASADAHGPCTCCSGCFGYHLSPESGWLVHYHRRWAEDQRARQWWRRLPRVALRTGGRRPRLADVPLLRGAPRGARLLEAESEVGGRALGRWGHRQVRQASLSGRGLRACQWRYGGQQAPQRVAARAGRVPRLAVGPLPRGAPHGARLLEAETEAVGRVPAPCSPRHGCWF